MLNADELGEKGEAHFKEICVNVSLTCNKSDRDRTGWDFLVEFPFETDFRAIAPLESRPVPLSCHIQVKTLQEKNDRFVMTLSSAERLAKELKPAFVYVFKVNTELQFTGAYLIHILDESLGTILKRLRKEDAEGNTAPNKKTISMSAKRYGKAVAPTGRGLRDALILACGNDLHAYTKKKVGQQARLGFSERPHKLTMTLHPKNIKDLVDLFLGKNKIKAEKISSVQERFGIKLPIPELSIENAIISLQPSPFDTCRIIVRDDQLGTPIVFKGNVFLPPGILKLSKEHFKVLIEADFFSLTLYQDRFDLFLDSCNSAQTLSAWASFWQLRLVMASGAGTIQITADTILISNTLNVPRQIDTIDKDQCAHWIHVCDQALALLRHVGVTAEPLLSMEAIADKADEIGSAHGLLHPENGRSPFWFSPIDAEPLSKLSSIDMVYVNYLVLGDVTLGFYGLARMDIEKNNNGLVELKTDNVVLKGMTQLRSFSGQYEELITAAKKETGCQNVFSRPFE